MFCLRGVLVVYDAVLRALCFIVIVFIFQQSRGGLIGRGPCHTKRDTCRQPENHKQRDQQEMVSERIAE